MILPQPRLPFSAIGHRSVKRAPPCGLAPDPHPSAHNHYARRRNLRARRFRAVCMGCKLCRPSASCADPEMVLQSSERTARRSAAVLDWRSDELFVGSDSFVAYGAAGSVRAVVACGHRARLQSSERTARHSAASITALAMGAAIRPPAMSLRGMLASSTITATATLGSPTGANEVNHANGLRLGSD